MTTLASKEIPLILIVDDDVIGRIMARATLETNGFSVAEAEDGIWRHCLSSKIFNRISFF